MPSDCEICPTEFWLSALRSQGRSPATIATYARAVAQLRTWAGTDDLTGITRRQAIAFADHLGETHKPGGVAIAIRSLRAGWSWMLDEGLVNENVFARMKISVPDEPQRTATDDEIERMLTHAKPNRRDFALLTVLVHTGARRGELAHVEMADVDMRSRMITFRVSKTKARTGAVDGAACGGARAVVTQSWCRSRRFVAGQGSVLVGERRRAAALQ
jgi:site-specific recombinase XerD